ncbi:MAG TPA: tRNA lysidine(34) synthetase TilS [Gemmatimonadales bacterium]|nr:tRNA lysidine(34) synthetase TilS [Gemmatimonadales bacterium]
MPPSLSLPDRFRTHIVRARLFRRRPPGTAVVAVSGGADSVALLDLLHGVAPELGLTLVVAHADHGIQSPSRQVAKSVSELAERYGLPFETTELHLGPEATETEARRARYAWLREVQRRHGAAYLVTAHHRDDQIETVVLRALRGSAPAGLAGMARRGRGGLVRPLLPFTRGELAEYAAARGLPAHDDPANRDPRHLRSWVRTQLLPLLKDRLGPRVADDLRRLGRHAARDRRAWDRVLELATALDLQTRPTGFDVAREGLRGYDDALAVALLRAAARRAGGGLVLGPARARRIVALARRPSGRRVSLGAGWTAEVAFDRVRVGRTPPRRAAQRVVPVGEEGSAVFGAFRIRWGPATAPARFERAAWTTWIDGPGWELRAPAAGDALVPLGGVGRRPLRRLLMDARVPRSERARYPVVARGGTILWVPGICRSGDGLPAPGTEAVRLDVTEYGAAEADRRA